MVESLARIAEQEQDAIIYLEDLFISPQLESQIHKFEPSSLVVFLYACSVLGTKSGRLLGRLVSMARHHLTLQPGGTFTAHELTAIICALAKLNFRPDQSKPLEVSCFTLVTKSM
jgi:hypothetical protein